MSTYLPAGTKWTDHHRHLEEALDGIGFLTDRDMVALMGGDLNLCDERDLALARADLRAIGYRERPIALWGRRPLFLRWEKVAFDPRELAAQWS